MTNVVNMKPPKRYLVEVDTNDYGEEIANLVDATGEVDPVYIEGLESPWLGLPLSDILKNAENGTYGNSSPQIVEQCRKLMKENQ